MHQVAARRHSFSSIEFTRWRENKNEKKLYPDQWVGSILQLGGWKVCTKGVGGAIQQFHPPAATPQGQGLTQENTLTLRNR